MRVLVAIAPCLLVVLARTAVHAADAPSPPAPSAPAAPPTAHARAADAVLVAVAAKDDAALKALAAKDDPDPWLVADELIRRTEHDAAAAFARAAPRADTDALPAYVASRRGKPDDPERRARLAAANAALADRQPLRALDALGPDGTSDPGELLAVRMAMAGGVARRALVQPDAAAAAFRAAGDAAERIGWIAGAARAFYESASSASRAAAYEGCLDALERWRIVSERRGDGSSAARALGNRGSVLERLGDHAGALAAYERAWTQAKSCGDPGAEAMMLNGVAGALHNLGEHERALAAYERALAVSGAEEVEAVGIVALAGIGRVHQARKDHEKALATYARALALAKAAGDGATSARILGQISTVQRLRGEYAKALAALEEALAAATRLGDRFGVTRCLAGLGSVYSALGDHRAALSAHLRALEQLEAIGDKVKVVEALMNVAHAHLDLSDHDAALAAYARAEAASTALGADRSVALARAGIGDVHLTLGDHAKAVEGYERALETLEALGDEGGAAAVRSNLALARAHLGDHEAARADFGRALATQEALGLRAEAATTLANLAAARFLANDLPGSVAAARDFVRRSDAMGRGLADAEVTSFRESGTYVYDAGILSGILSGDAGDMAFFLETGRAGALSEGLVARSSIPQEALPPALRSEDERARSLEARAVAALRRATEGDDLAEIRRKRAALEAAQDAVAAVVARIQREAKAGAAIVYPQAATLDEVRATLSAGDALVLYALTERAAAALVVEPAGARIVKLGARDPVDEAADAVVAVLEDPESDAAGALASLGARVVKPLALGEGVKRVLVSPTGSLSYVPFAALLPDRTVAYVPSGTTYRLLREDEALRGEGVLALGDPDYATKVDERALAVHRGGTARLAPLPGTRKEVEAVGEVRLLGTEATEAGLKAALGQRARWRAVHLACHGLVNTERPALSSLAVTASGDDDGFLTCLDVFRLKVPADLVVLSACETGRGKVVKSEGIVGLTRAFMFAGAPRVLCSLWKVDDAATAALMTKFYELWNPKGGAAGLPAAQALRRAQEHVRGQAKWTHPYYWAAWVLWGLPS